MHTKDKYKETLLISSGVGIYGQEYIGRGYMVVYLISHPYR